MPETTETTLSATKINDGLKDFLKDKLQENMVTMRWFMCNKKNEMENKPIQDLNET